MATEAAKPTAGLRERKKARTKADIYRQALRLFREQGYDETTIEQIAEAAEVSPSTVFRYFPTKEALVLWDELDEAIIGAFQAQPAALSPILALRNAMRTVFASLPPERQALEREREALLLAQPQLRAALINQFSEMIQQVTAVVAERVGRRPDDFAVRNLAGAVIGVAMAVFLAKAEDPAADLIALMDAAFGHLEAGLPL